MTLRTMGSIGDEDSVLLALEDGEVVVNKAILCQSPYFSAMFSGVWMEDNTGRVQLKGFTKKTVVMFADFISNRKTPEVNGANIQELVMFADILDEDTFRRAVAQQIKQKLFHNFHRPCQDCATAVVQFLPISCLYNLDALRKSSVSWIIKHFQKVAVLKDFSHLDDEIKDSIRSELKKELNFSTVFETVRQCQRVVTSLPLAAWTETTRRLCDRIRNDCHDFLSANFVEFLKSEKFIQVSQFDAWNLEEITDILEASAERLSGDHGCASFALLKTLVEREEKQLEEDPDRDQSTLNLANLLIKRTQKSIIRHLGKAMKSKEWLLLSKEVQERIQNDACFLPIEGPGSAQPPVPSVEVRKAVTTQERYRKYSRPTFQRKSESDDANSSSKEMEAATTEPKNTAGALRPPKLKSNPVPIPKPQSSASSRPGISSRSANTRPPLSRIQQKAAQPTPRTGQAPTSAKPTVTNDAKKTKIPRSVSNSPKKDSVLVRKPSDRCILSLNFEAGPSSLPLIPGMEFSSLDREGHSSLPPVTQFGTLVAEEVIVAESAYADTSCEEGISKNHQSVDENKNSDDGNQRDTNANAIFGTVEDLVIDELGGTAMSYEEESEMIGRGNEAGVLIGLSREERSVIGVKETEMDLIEESAVVGKETDACGATVGDVIVGDLGGTAMTYEEESTMIGLATEASFLIGPSKEGGSVIGFEDGEINVIGGKADLQGDKQGSERK